MAGAGCWPGWLEPFTWLEQEPKYGLACIQERIKYPSLDSLGKHFPNHLGGSKGRTLKNARSCEADR